MKRLFLAAIIVGVLFAPLPLASHAQTPGATGPRWETRSADTGVRSVSGVETFRVGRDTASTSRPAGVSFVVRLPRTKETFVCDKLPYMLRWDTTKVSDGWHWLEVVLVDPGAAVPERVIDSLKVYVRNDSATPPPVIAPAATPDAAPATSALTKTNTAQPRPPIQTLPSRRGWPLAHALRMRALPDASPSEAVPATIADSAAPLSMPRVSMLTKYGNTLYLGLPDGGIATWNEATKRGSVVRVTGMNGAVRALAVGGEGFSWISGASGDRVFTFNARSRSVTAFDVGERPTSTAGAEAADVSTAPVQAPWVERLAMLGERLVLMGALATRVRESDGTLKSLADVLPADIASTYSDTLVRCYMGSGAKNSDAVLLFATPDAGGGGGSLHLWSGDARTPLRKWSDGGQFMTRADLTGSGSPSLALTSFGVVIPECAEGYGRVSMLQCATWADRAASFAPRPIPLGVSGDYNARAPQSADAVSIGGSGIWWTQGGIVFHADSSGERRECYMPWNGAGSTVTALLADREGAFVATEHGVRRLQPAHPTDADGYGGYVRVPLGDEYATPRGDRGRTLLVGIEEWQGVPYKWGGTTKSGTDCSGFVGAMHLDLGITLPRTSAEMGRTKQGARVRDELRYGDTLVYPGHVALYIGNGRTAETVGGDSAGAPGSVGKATIWRRRDVIVKRFLP